MNGLESWIPAIFKVSKQKNNRLSPDSNFLSGFQKHLRCVKPKDSDTEEYVKSAFVHCSGRREFLLILNEQSKIGLTIQNF